LRQLVSRDWFAFEQPALTRDLARDEELNMDMLPAASMAASLATARYFALYLQERGKLQAIYQGLRALQPSEQPNQNVSATTMALIERELGMDMDRADADFIRWFHSFPDPKIVANSGVKK
jgi:hypothetical protein